MTNAGLFNARLDWARRSQDSSRVNRIGFEHSETPPPSSTRRRILFYILLPRQTLVSRPFLASLHVFFALISELCAYLP